MLVADRVSPAGLPARNQDVQPIFKSEVLFRSDLVTVGTFRVTPMHPEFQTAGQFHRPEFVFPRTSVWIEHENGHKFVADPTVITYYNGNERYVRRPVDPIGDHGDWFAVDSSVLLQTLAAYDRRVEERADRPFRLPYGPSDAQTIATQRALMARIENGHADALAVEEGILRVLAGAVGAAYRTTEREAQSPSKRDVEVAAAARVVILRHFTEELTLGDIAENVGASVFNLCRQFRRAYGMTLHTFRNELRLRAALDLMRDFDRDLTGLALHLGYSSHSHFTYAFRRAFGVSPANYRSSLV
jgi:AraC family transcriptional regulator